ncbi:MAG: hypothetical protein II789_05955, partial [Clostridia bacterium]|nr:hypothetical protein [Clostridia bacterium]
GGKVSFQGSQQQEYALTADNLPGTITALQFVEDQNNAGHYILQKKTLFSSASWTNEANFNIAATQFYQNALAAGRIIGANDNIVSGTLTVSSGSPVTLYPGHVIGGVTTKVTDYALTVSAAGSSEYTRYFANASLNPITSLTIPAGESRQIHIAYDDSDGIQILEDSMIVTAESGGGGGGTTHDIQCSSTVESIGTDRGNRTNAGAISKQNLQAYSYLGFTISCSGETKSFYITINP